ncbi:ribonuclease HII, partial [Candidatus Woesearchaeota archaeon]|nr:ribonuclease HII [Candidatus Woesearchaeota archaeon]
GPVLGPLVMAGVLIDEREEQKLMGLGVKDSKLLTREQREKLYKNLILLKYKTIILSPSEIDQALRSLNTNLNWLEAQTSAKILNELNPSKAIIDCPSPNIKAYHDYLKRLVDNKEMELILKHRAEVHPSVAAASIIAKVTRDTIIDEMKKEIGIDFGSGYMSDPLTQTFLEAHHNSYPHLFRQGWASYKAVIVRKQQTSLNKF